MERSFKKEVAQLRLGEGEIFSGEGILAVTKALLQSGVSYIGGYQGAPVSHLLDVMVDSSELLDELGVHLETPTNEAAAAAMLAASINYPMRGAVTWKSVVGTNVASDALSNLSSAGVIGGAMIVIGEDYGEGASIIQERSHAFAMKSSMCLLDPRPNLTSIVDTVEKGFELSEASNMPVMLQLRIRACHISGRFAARDNRPPLISRNQLLSEPDFNIDRFCLPPSTYLQEKHKIEYRLPAAERFVTENKLNEVFDGDLSDIGIITLGGLYNGVVRALERVGLSDIYGASRVPIYVMNVAYPVVPKELEEFCLGKKSVLVVEEGYPDYIEQAVHVALRKADVQTRVLGKQVLPKVGEYTADVVLGGVEKFLELEASGNLTASLPSSAITHSNALKARAAELLGTPIPPRPPSFCTGCPERPVFSAMKIVEKELGPTHIAADVGCHTFSALPPFNLGNTMVGYGLGLASSAGVGPNFGKRVISIMGDGGFWHNGISSGVASANFNKHDSILVIMKNGYSSATGWQFLPSSKGNRFGGETGMSIENALKGLGIKWVRTVRTYNVSKMAKTLRQAVTETKKGLKVIIADGECQLARQRRLRPLLKKRLDSGRRVIRTRFGIDDDLCTGDHSCIRMSGCPSLTIKPNPDPLRTDPVAHVNNECVGCGLCGEVAHAAALCPSFYRAEIVQNPNILDRLLDSWRQALIGALQGLVRA
ncbi:MAG TPA: indolepyruvate ferredoxin oxidoreductase subunit alpha [Alphaproteobacteria bacterium]|nr:indolepyruvate ferredoxin oxidoreductase subunit alpha [Alphaproteobacteria bacterium]HIB18429.1 indolepyruvate ferredoxin oxidoreductase subunit alpha [Alphaproteobacteria bacterium]HIB56946.1 indolepyruvate ferredoxin oxidoreductase subunit alpha [Alphaproteobacteria bacterium]HIN92312.1 indolepyruvate ferredoxin oxidoreductase subunit alpha [Alphaproteobacteria bacterium]HIO01928.1 indolepyruvate ferredoxin oxidoreductase subunit alpha [Alphaproteobacteria bacterium]